MASLSQISEVELMRRFVEGDEGSFEMLVERYEAPLLNFFFRLTRDRQAAEDLVQETFLRVVRSKGTYQVKASFRTFIYRIGRNLWIDRYRSAKCRPRTLSMNRPAGDEKDRSVDERFEGSELPPGANLEFAETRELLMKAIDGLPGTQREVFVLWLETGLKYAEISKILDIPVGTIKSRMHTAVHRLKESLGRHLEL